LENFKPDQMFLRDFTKSPRNKRVKRRNYEIKKKSSKSQSKIMKILKSLAESKATPSVKTRGDV